MGKLLTRAKALGVVARGRSVDASTARGSSKVTRYRETEDRDGMCVNICAAI